MTSGKKCPYCGGKAKIVDARVVGKPTHLTYGYGERTFQCGRCGEMYSVCYAIPPKGSAKDMPDPNKGILHESFTNGVSGYADPVVLKASAPVPETRSPQEPEIQVETTSESKGDSIE